MSGWALSFINCVGDSMGVKTHCPFGRIIMGHFYHLFHVYVTWIRNWLQVYHFDKQDWRMVAGLCHYVFSCFRRKKTPRRGMKTSVALFSHAGVHEYM